MKNFQKNSRPKSLLNILAFSRKYGISRPTVYKLLKMRLLPVQTFGKRQFINDAAKILVENALKELPGTGNYSGRICTYKPPKPKSNFDAESDRRFAEFERGEEQKRLKKLQKL